MNVVTFRLTFRRVMGNILAEMCVPRVYESDPEASGDYSAVCGDMCGRCGGRGW